MQEEEAMFEPIKVLPKSATGISGLDEILNGGLPQGRPTLVCGSAGCGKTLLAMEFLVRGATQFDEPGVFMAFEEAEHELVQNVASLGFDLPGLIADKKMLIDFVHIAREEIQETGEYDLEGLFIRLEHAISSIGARRVVLDTVESLFSGLPNPLILRSELRRLFRWLKDKGVTAIITGERGDGTLTRHGLEEYVSDCVILLDHRVIEQISTRRLRVAKYRGSIHGTNEYPFLIDEEGISVVPVTSLGLQHAVSSERVPTGIPQLDNMLGGKGYYRGSTILVSGTAGTGKSSVAAHFAEVALKRQERVLYFAFEESPAQFLRNMCSVGIDLKPWLEKGFLHFDAARPATYGLEMHLATMHKKINQLKPDTVIVDPINAFIIAHNEVEVKAMLIRLVDFLKMKNVTALFTSLTPSGGPLEHTDTAISSLIDTWLLLRNIEAPGERNRSICILKSRGMAHSNKVCEFFLTDQGIHLAEACRNG
jgi:circadian clock protein KaiC